MSTPTRFLVVGSAHLDIVSTITGDGKTMDKMGNVSIDIGGTACNVATNLHQLGSHVTLLTALNGSPYSMFVTNFLVQRGIDVVIDRDETLPLGAFSAHINARGEMIDAVSNTPVDRHHFDDAVVESAIDKVNCVILDCNLSEKTLHQIAEQAAERMIPIYLAGVGEEKSLRAVKVAPFAAAFFMNRREANYLAQALSIPPENAIVGLAKALGTTLVITDGRKGAFVARATSGIGTLIPPPPMTDGRNYLGMGDAFLAGTLYAHLDFEFNLEDAATVMTPMVSRIIAESSGNTGSDGAINEMLDDMRQRAFICPTTHILNRSATEQELSRLIHGMDAGSHQLSVAIIDLDFFKTINDTLGHNVGDQVLELTANALRSVLRGQDVVGRWGGDEFLALMVSDAATGRRIASRMQEAVAKACAGVYPVTLSIGVAEWEPAMATGKNLVETADKALYDAKRGGRNRVV